MRLVVVLVWGLAGVLALVPVEAAEKEGPVCRYRGYLDELTIWSRALGAEQVDAGAQYPGTYAAYGTGQVGGCWGNNRAIRVMADDWPSTPTIRTIRRSSRTSRRPRRSSTRSSGSTCPASNRTSTTCAS